MWKRVDKFFGGLRDEESGAFFGPHVAFNGRLHFDGTLRIDGRLEGQIHTTGTLEVGGSGELKGLITVGTLINGGRIAGTVIADRVRLLASSVLVGSVHAPLLAIEEGARFQGQSELEPPRRRLRHQAGEVQPEEGLLRSQPAPVLIDCAPVTPVARPPG